MEKYLSTIAFILGLTAIINVVGFIGIYNLLKDKLLKAGNEDV